MWIITVYSKNGVKMFEYDNQEEARDTFNSIKGNKVLSEVIYYNDFDVVETPDELKQVNGSKRYSRVS